MATTFTTTTDTRPAARTTPAAFRHPADPTVGMGLALTAIGMLFIALTSAYIVRQGIDPLWQTIRMPAILLFNTGILLASSLTLEQARRGAAPSGDVPAAWLWATLALGLVFLAGQWMAWRQLSAAGVYLASNAHSSFFYLLTALHGLHLAGGILALGWLCLRRATARHWVGTTAFYWHFMGGLWVYLLALLFGWR